MPRSHKVLNRRTSEPSYWDVDAAAYLNVVRAAGRNVTYRERYAIDEWVKFGKARGWWATQKELWLTGWGHAGSNALGVKLVSNMTWNGTVTHAAGSVQFGASSYGNTGIQVSTSGWNINSVGLTVYRKDAPNTGIQCADMACNDQVGGNGSSFVHAINFGNILSFTDYGRNQEGRHQYALQTLPGLYCTTRQSASTSRHAIIYNNGSTNSYSSTGLANGTPVNFGFTRFIYLGGMDADGTPAFFSQGQYAFAAIQGGSGLTNTQQDNFNSDTFNMLTRIGWV